MKGKFELQLHLLNGHKYNLAVNLLMTVDVLFLQEGSSLQ